MALTNWFHENYYCIHFPWVFKWIFVPVVILNFIYLTILYRTSYKSFLKGSLLISVDHGFSALALLTCGTGDDFFVVGGSPVRCRMFSTSAD